MDEIERIERLAKLKRGRAGFDKVKEWAEEFEGEMLPHLQEAADKAESLAGFVDEITELTTALENLVSYGFAHGALAGRVSALQEEIEVITGEESPARAVVDFWEELEGQLSEFEGMLDAPRDFEMEEKDQAWDEVLTSLGNIADSLKSLSVLGASAAPAAE